MSCARMLRMLVIGTLVLLPVSASAQQTGAIIGKVVDTGGGVLPGVTVEARSDVLPSPRTTVTEVNGQYRLQAGARVDTKPEGERTAATGDAS